MRNFDTRALQLMPNGALSNHFEILNGCVLLGFLWLDDMVPYGQTSHVPRTHFLFPDYTCTVTETVLLESPSSYFF
jgi:hypothetical protein